MLTISGTCNFGSAYSSDFNLNTIQKKLEEYMNGPKTDREYTIYTGRGGMDLINEEFKKQVALSPDITEDSFPTEPEQLF